MDQKSTNRTSSPTKRVGVICAHNPRNSGMYTVDAAAKKFFSQKGIPFDLLLTQGRDQIGGLQYRMIKDQSDLLDYDTIVYWGDFLNNPMWGLDCYPERPSGKKGKSTTAEWEKLYLDLKEWHPLAKVHVIGGCALGAAKYLTTDSVLRTRYRRFIEKADTVILRDPMSFDIVRELSPNQKEHIKLGFDCASLIKEFNPAPRKGGYFTHSFHRSLSKAEAQYVITTIERQTGLHGVAINWLNNHWPRRAFHWRLAGQRKILRYAAFCVTDIYHLSICSMAEGTATICFGKPEATVNDTLNEKKKELLFQMLEIENRYVQWNPELISGQLNSLLREWQDISQSPDSWSRGFLAAQGRLRIQLDHLFTPARSPRRIAT